MHGQPLLRLDRWRQPAAEREGGIVPAAGDEDAIPGTGEDIDGDGQYDPGITMSDIEIGVPLNDGYWAGNIPPGDSTYDSFATMGTTNIDAALYTNHTFAWVTFGSSQARINGGLVSRNEDIIYGTPSVAMNYDCRLLGGSSGLAGDLLPKTAGDTVVVRWASLDEDPNHFGVAP